MTYTVCEPECRAGWEGKQYETCAGADAHDERCGGENLEKSLALIRRAAGAGAELIVFPEIQLSPFFPQYEKQDASRWALTPDSPEVRAVCKACAEAGIWASPNFYMEEAGRRYDMSLLIDSKGNIVGKQKMVHIAQAACFYEQDYYTPSEEGFQVFDTPLGKLGVVVCFDRHLRRLKAEPSALFQWEVKVQAFQNSVNIAMCNRVGPEGAMDFSGESLVSDYNGETLALAGDEEELLICEVDLPGAKKTREQKPYTSLRRPELYR